MKKYVGGDFQKIGHPKTVGDLVNMTGLRLNSNDPSKNEEVIKEADIKMVDQVFDSGKQFKDFFKFMKSKFKLSLKGKVTPGENGDDFTLSGSDTNIQKYLFTFLVYF